MVVLMSERLTSLDWIKHGLRTLASQGSAGLKVAPMAATLKVSRGSFYWHFRDIADFERHLLQCWQDATTEQVIRELEAGRSRPERLKYLIQRAFRGTRHLDRAIRAWAATDVRAACVVASVDARRVAYIAELLETAGVAPTRAASRAAFMYWAYLGQAAVMEPRLATIATAELDAIGELFESP